ncbi:MAG: flagellar FliJ family protein [Nitrospirae bacterium]|nr:flagellar FliJ family protein [Nitrospirota bacterium]
MANVKTLERIQQLREYKKNEIAQEVRRAAMFLHMEEKNLGLMETELNENIIALDKKKIAPATSIHEITLFYDYIDTMYRKIDGQKVIINKIAMELAAKERELLEAFKDVKVIETLKDKIVNEEKKRQSTLEQKTMDYLYLSRMPKA